VYVEPENSTAATTGVSNGFATGTVTLNYGSSTSTQTLNSEGVAAFALYDEVPGSYSFTAQYTGDASYKASSTTTAVPLVITKGATAVAVHIGSATAAAPGKIQVELQTDSAGEYPTGSVSLTVNGQLYTGTTTDETLSDGAVGEVVTYSVPATALGSSATLQASYAGDTNYSGDTSASCTYVPPTTSSAQLVRPERHATGLAAAACGTVGCLLFLLVPARKRAWKSLLLMCLAVGIFGSMGCGSTSTQTKIPITGTSTCSQ
jgi:hypothetical protein